MSRTPIEWVIADDGRLGFTVNPIRAKAKRGGAVGHFCEKVSPGCTNCYASRLQSRFRMFPFEQQYRKRVSIFMDYDRLAEVLRRKQATAYFWEDMSDIFGDWVKDSWIDAIVATMALTPKDVHMILTKRSKRQREYFEGLATLRSKDLTDRLYEALPKELRPDKMPSISAPIPRIRVGVSIENQPTANKRLPDLILTPAWDHFVSYEPVLGPVTLKWACCTCPDNDKTWNFKSGVHQDSCPFQIKEGQPISKLLGRIIYGGESGPGARPDYLQYLKSMIRQTSEVGLSLFVKQLGKFPTMSNASDKDAKPIRFRLNSSKGSDPTEWPAEYRIRQWPVVA